LRENERKLWTIKDLAEFLQIPTRRAYRVRCPRLKIGGLLRFDPGEVRAWAAKQNEG